MKKIILITFLVVLNISSFAQQKTNIEIFFELSDSVAVVMNDFVKTDDDLFVQFNLVGDYKIFENRIITNLSNVRKNFLFLESGQKNKLILSFERVVTNFSEPFRISIFGDHKVERRLNIKGTLNLIGETNSTKNFSITHKDTLDYSSVNEVISEGFPFTKDTIPEPPFFSSIIEPIALISAAAITIYLFFSVRSR
ncbi:MAG: hypothetical protein C0425_10650 [Chlorobiaceae bacterium]|nr:hypothetical protein [Chlorobiaceae bacterium]